jgi:hypothetical protein
MYLRSTNINMSTTLHKKQNKKIIRALTWKGNGSAILFDYSSRLSCEYVNKVHLIINPSKFKLNRLNSSNDRKRMSYFLNHNMAADIDPLRSNSRAPQRTCNDFQNQFIEQRAHAQNIKSIIYNTRLRIKD